MSEPNQTQREANDVYDELSLKLSHIVALLDIMATCDHEQCDVNGAAFAIQRMVEDTGKLAKGFYEAGGAS